MPSWLDIRIQLTGLRRLTRELGWMRAVQVGIAAQRGGDAFAALGPAQDDQDAASRAQLAPAIALYRALRLHLDAEESLRVAGAVIHDASLRFLEHAIGEVDLERYRASTPNHRRAYLQGIMEQFVNADARIEVADEEGFVQVVTRCRFVELCRAAGVPELAPAFCAGDLAFFSRGPVRLDRPGTLAEGADACEFRFSLRGEGG